MHFKRLTRRVCQSNNQSINQSIKSFNRDSGTPLTRGVHPPKANDAFSPVSDYPLSFQNFSESWKIFPTFPQFRIPSVFPKTLHFPPFFGKFIISSSTFEISP